ncbi:hypothetical protein ACHWQZ_G007685 [Mnemiopsis leidyi]
MLFFPFLLFLLCPSPIIPSCPLDKQKLEARNVKFLKSTWNPNNDPEAPTQLQSQSVIEIMCAQEAYTFINRIRRTPGVDLAYLDTWGAITATCDTGSIYPNVFTDETNEYYDFYCRPGCSRILETDRVSLYPPQTATQELNSAPVRHSNIAVSVKCNEGYAQAVGDGGKATISCSHLVGWDASPDQLIRCLPGCSDIRFDVSKGFTQTSRTGSDGQPPFKAGDIVKFDCDNGYTMQGYSTVTCSGTNVWSYSLPKCVYEGASGAILAQVALSFIPLLTLQLLLFLGF